MRTVDLRSDTVTLPSPEMRTAISEAQLGDDVYGEDPTVNRLQQLAAERAGKQAALLVPSGTMANLIGVMAHCQRGEEAILGDMSHTFLYEAGGIASLGSVHPHTIANQPDGTLLLSDIESAIRPDDAHFPRTRLICLENTHNRCSGSPLTPAYVGSVGALAAAHGLRLHVDGARIFNAAVALGVDVAELAGPADSVSFCLSKGLACPVGSLVCGSTEFIAAAHRIRKSLGGGMRQAGIIAAAGIVALQRMVDRLAEDHANASRLAEGIALIEGLSVDPESVRTNIVYFDVTAGEKQPAAMLATLAEKGVRMINVGPQRFRAVTHYGIEPADIDHALNALAEVLTAR